jgi:hypothetical protein
MTRRPTVLLRCASALAIAAFAAAGAGRAQPRDGGAPSDTRAELPIREVVLSDGEHRYVVSIQMGSTTIEAGLDSGSTGLRILPGVLKPADAQASSQRTSYSYTSGTQFDGIVAEAQAGIGLAGRVKFQQIEKVGCRAGEPCPAARVPPEQFGIQGSGLPGEGFKAILGINMEPQAVANPLVQLGVRRWIIELPRPDEGRPGRLVLNPGEAEIADYKVFHTDSSAGDAAGAHDAISACIVNPSTRRSYCGPGVLDTGAPGIQIMTSEPGSPWPASTPLTLAFMDSGKPALGASFAVGSGPGTRLTILERPRARNPRLILGVLPYYAFSVLYDPQARTVGLKAR